MESFGLFDRKRIPKNIFKKSKYNIRTISELATNSSYILQDVNMQEILVLCEGQYDYTAKLFDNCRDELIYYQGDISRFTKSEFGAKKIITISREAKHIPFSTVGGIINAKMY